MIRKSAFSNNFVLIYHSYERRGPMSPSDFALSTAKQTDKTCYSPRCSRGRQRGTLYPDNIIFSSKDHGTGHLVVFFMTEFFYYIMVFMLSVWHYCKIMTQILVPH